MDNQKSQDYQQKVIAEGEKWTSHLETEAAGEWHAWLDHPVINSHYQQRALIEGESWPEWVKRRLGGKARRSLELGCGSGSRSLAFYHQGVTAEIEGYDVSTGRIAEAEALRQRDAAPGRFEVIDVNYRELERDAYDLIFSCHSFHHFLQLEHILEQVHEALRPGGLFVLEEYIGPTQFQWTDLQISLVRSLLTLLPERLRRLRWGAIKFAEGRPTPEEVEAASPFESIRSAEIGPLFERYFRIVELRNLGGTLQHLLYNGIIHNFHPEDPEAASAIQSIIEIEDALIDSGGLPSDFALLVGTRKS